MEITGANSNWYHTDRLYKMLPRQADKGRVTSTFCIRQRGRTLVLSNRLQSIWPVFFFFCKSFFYFAII